MMYKRTAVLVDGSFFRIRYRSIYGSLPDDPKRLANRLYSIMRSSEVRLLKRHQIDFERGIISIEGKGGKYRIIPIIQKLKPILEALAQDKQADDYLLICNKTDKPYTPSIGHLSMACKKAGITQHITAHTLRHCFATHCCMWGMDTRTVQMLLGHSSITTTQIYQTLAGSFLTEQMNRFGNSPTVIGGKDV